MRLHLLTTFGAFLLTILATPLNAQYLRSFCDDNSSDPLDIVDETDLEADVFEGDIAVFYDDISLEYGAAFANHLLGEGGRVMRSGHRETNPQPEPAIRRLESDPAALLGESRSLIVTSNLRYRWQKREEGKVIIPYRLSEPFNTSAIRQSILEGAMRGLEESGVVKFVKWENNQKHPDYIWVYGQVGSGGCWSYIGKIGGYQTVNLQLNGCVTHGIISHELMHVLGFWHEHTRPDRDDYVNIYIDRVRSGQEHNFAKRTSTQVSDLGLSYDYGSVMHYRKTAFSTGGNTIEPINPPTASIGQRSGPDAQDLRQITMAYQCTSGHRTVFELITAFAIMMAMSHLF